MFPSWMLVMAGATVLGSLAIGIKMKRDIKRIEEKYGGNDNEGYETNPN